MTLSKLSFPKTYDTETVRLLMEHATGHPCTTTEVANLSRPGKMLFNARVRYGAFDQARVMDVMEAITIRRLATQLGRTSQTYMDKSNSIKCPQCKAIAVKWNEKYLCEDGHTGNA